MKTLVVNPNISESVTKLIATEAERAKASHNELTFRTAQSGMEYIETRFESLLAANAVAEIIADNPGYDAVIVAAFGDPGLPALKELCRVPVIGMTEAALALASVQGTKFSIIAISERITAWYSDCVDAYGYTSRISSIRSLNKPLKSIGSVQEDHGSMLTELALSAVEQDGADVIVLAGAPLAGMARSVNRSIPVPVVDGISAVVGLAETVVALSGGSREKGSCGPPPRKRRIGLSAGLEAQISRQQEVRTSESKS